jgi:hypothetical protein
MTEQKLGTEIVDEMQKEPTLDPLFDNDPRGMPEEEFQRWVQVQRQKRALFMKKESDK